MIGFQRAGDKIIHAAAGQNVKTVYERQVHQGLYLPVVLCLRSHQNNLRFLGIIRGIEFVGRQELSVASRNLHHAHGSARLVPDGLLQVAVQVKQKALVHLLCRNQNVLRSVVGQRADRVAFFQFMCLYLIYLHFRLLIYLVNPGPDFAKAPDHIGRSVRIGNNIFYLFRRAGHASDFLSELGAVRKDIGRAGHALKHQLI